MVKILIIGGPRTGKTTKALRISELYNIPMLSTDSLVQVNNWSQSSDIVCDWVKQPGSWVIEGCSSVRGLRKWLKGTYGVPDFEILYMGDTKVERTPKQEIMAKGVNTIWRECKAEIDRRQILADRAKVTPQDADT